MTGKNIDILFQIAEKLEDIDDEEVLVVILDILSNDIHIGGYQNWENSCFLDSLLMILFASDERKHFIDAIFNSSLNNVGYNSSICEIESTLSSSNDIRKFAISVRDQLKEDYDRIITKKDIIKCINIRQLLSICIPSLKGKSRWLQVSPSVIYVLIASLFPDLMIREYPYVSMPSGSFGTDHDGVPTFMTIDYLNDISLHGQSILWDKIKVPYLVFMQGVSDESEAIRKFDETILDGKYELYASVLFSGRIPKTTKANKPQARLGGHYTSFFKINNQWVLYNDTSPHKITKLDKLPSFAYERETKSIPDLLFYRKIVKDLY